MLVKLTMTEIHNNEDETMSKALFAVRIGAEDWQEELITENSEQIDSASAWARANGFDRLRVITVDGEIPNFAGTVTI